MRRQILHVAGQVADRLGAQGKSNFYQTGNSAEPQPKLGGCRVKRGVTTASKLLMLEIGCDLLHGPGRGEEEY